MITQKYSEKLIMVFSGTNKGISALIYGCLIWSNDPKDLLVNKFLGEKGNFLLFNAFSAQYITF